MAMNAASSANHPSPLSTISISLYLYHNPTTKSCLHLFNTNTTTTTLLHLPSSSRHGSRSAPTAAVALAPVADTITESAVAFENLWALKEESNEEDDEEEEVLVRRKRRRKRRKAGLGILANEKVADNVFLMPENSGQYLSPKQEAEYSFCLKEEARIEAVRKRIEEAASKDEEVSLSQWAKAAGMSTITLDKILCNGKEARDRITRCYRRLVISVASSYQGRGLSLQDLIQEGNLGLIHGAKKFNPDKGYKLSTYVYWWIRQAMSRAVAKKSRLTRLPGSISELVPKICEANAVLSRRLGKYPTCDEIAKVVNKDSLTVALALERNRDPISLDQAMSAGDRMSLQDIIAGPEEITPEAMVKKELMKKELEKLLKRLSEREKAILRLYYGVNGHTPLSFEDTGRRLKLSRERVRQISCDALQKLRQCSMLNDLKLYFL